MTDNDPPVPSETAPATPEFDEPDAMDGTEDELLPTPRDPVHVPYHRIRPPDAPYDEYNYAQRRAVLLRRIERVGHPRALNQSYRDLADEFGVSSSTIGEDMQVLAAYMAEHVERDHVSIMDAVFRGAVLDLVDDGERARAAEIGREWFEWLADMGEVERVADKLDLDATVRQAGDTDAYRVIEDTEAEAVEFVENEGEP